MIERTEINGNFSALKTALETLVPAYFGSVEMSDDTYTISCKDADGNTIFQMTRSSNNAVWTPIVYRNASNSLRPSTTNYTYPVTYFYSMGANGAVLVHSGSYFTVIAKAANGKTAVVLPYNTQTNGQKLSSILAGCWGDDTAYDKPLKFADESNPCVGNQCLFVPVPLYGSYQTPNNVPKVFFMPVAQVNMRGIVQEVTSDSGTYITNGYLAMLYDAGGEA